MKTQDFSAYYSEMVVSILDVVLARTLRQADTDRMFIDTKFSTITGKDFADDDPIRGRGTVYTWIQGRGMESLAAHSHWLETCAGISAARRQELQDRIRLILGHTVANMERLRQRNSGRLFFMMSTEGTPLTLNAHSALVPLAVTGREAANMSELFYVKGLASAAKLLGNEALLGETCTWYTTVHRDIMEDRFYNDQQCLDPKNLAVKPVPGRRSNAPKMIAIGGAFRFLELTPDRQWVTYGMDYLDYILNHHVNLPRARKHADLPDYAFWEFIDEEGRPWADEQGRVFSDPGHALEFVGLAFRFLSSVKAFFADAMDAQREAYLKTTLCGILTGNFERAFSPDGFGICKSVDLVTGAPINSDMPWWNLPEAMRAAAYAAANDPDHREMYLRILTRISDAFRAHYVRPELNLFAYQSLDAAGHPVDAIPGTPDADPGYHTSLSLMDVLCVVDRMVCDLAVI